MAHLKHKEETRKKHLQIKGLLSALQNCAAHPDQKDLSRPFFLSAHYTLDPIEADGGLMGSLILESFLGASFSNVANDTTPLSAVLCINPDQVAEAFSEYLKDTHDDKRGKGTYALDGHTPKMNNVIANDFNTSSLSPRAQAMHAFLGDLPRREQLERHIAQLVSEIETLNAMNEYEPTAAPTLYAA